MVEGSVTSVLSLIKKEEKGEIRFLRTTTVEDS